MHVVTTIAETRALVRALKAQGHRIVFVPTMGALHEGHLTLVDVAKQHGDIVIVSIFVNPTQFGPNEDFSRYPRTLEADLASLDARGVHAVFTPSVEEMYPSGSVTTVTSAPHDAFFEGAQRPGHFTGVLTVVNKLFNIVQPDAACFGQKDLQQLSFVRRMVRDLDMPVEIVMVPTVREADGLAMSSRNRYLAPDDRARATRLSATLRALQAAFATGESRASELATIGRALLAQDPAITLGYLDIVDPLSFTPVATAQPGHAIVLAARVGGTRLLDNVIL